MAKKLRLQKHLFFLRLLLMSFVVLSCSVEVSPESAEKQGSSFDQNYSPATNPKIIVGEDLVDPIKKPVVPKAPPVPEGPRDLEKSMFMLTKEHISSTLQRVYPGVFVDQDFISMEESSYKLEFLNKRATVNAMLDLEKFWLLTDTLVNKIFAATNVALISTCKPLNAENACIKTALDHYGRLLFRRGLSTDESLYFQNLVKSQGNTAINVQLGFKMALIAMFNSPEFLYAKFYGDQDGRLTELELASRISFFLLKANPPDSLLKLAEENKLSTVEEVKAAIIDLLKEESIKGNFFADFVNEAWQFSLVEESLIADYEAEDFNRLIGSFRQEFNRTANALGNEFDLKWQAIFDSSYTFLNKPLSTHYAIPSSSTGAGNYVKVSLPEERRGLLSLGLSMAAHSAAKYTSTTHRGLFILNKVLCAADIPTPVDLEELIKNSNFKPLETDTVRQRIDKIAAEPTCGSCHKHFDHYGMVMENFDGLGRYYTGTRYGAPIDSNSVVDGKQISSLKELNEIILKRPETPQCFFKHMFAYSTGQDLPTSNMQKLIADKVDFAALASLRDIALKVAEQEWFYRVKKD